MTEGIFDFNALWIYSVSPKKLKESFIQWPVLN